MLNKFAVVRWLLSHAEVLKEIGDIVSTWGEDSSLSHRLEIVYKVAQAILPVIEDFPFFQSQSLSQEEAEADLAKVEAMGIGTPILIHVIVPIVINLIRAMIDKDD